MSFEKLYQAIGDNTAAMEVAKALETEMGGAVAQIKSFEAKFNEAKTGRDEAKAKLREIADTFGVDITELNSETLKGKKGDDKSKAEIEALAKKMQELDSSYQSKLKESDERYTNKVIEYEIAKAGLAANVVNDKALSLVIESLKNGAVLDEGGIVYKDKDGSTMRTATGQPMSIADKMAQFQADTNNAFLFKATAQGGGGANPSSKSPAGKVMSRADFDGLSPSAQMSFVKDGGKVE